MTKPGGRRQTSLTRLLAVSASVALCLADADTVLAHMETPVTPENVWRSWNVDPLVLVPLLVIAGLYVMGMRTINANTRPGSTWTARRSIAFAGGMLALFIALVSPVDQMGGALFSMHMVQHLLLVLVAAPLLVYAAPLAPVLVALPRGARRLAGDLSGRPAVRRLRSVLTNVLVVWWLQAIALWVWHIPALYEAALRNRWVHSLEHVTFLATAMLFWWLVLQPFGRRTLEPGLSVLFIFTTMIQSSALGALITFAPSSWYAAHAPYVLAWGITPLEDQQLAGLIMWVPGGLVYLGAALTALLLWLRSMDASERDHPVGRVLDSVSDMNRTHTPRSG